MQRKEWQLPPPLPCSAAMAGEALVLWGPRVTAGRCLDTALTWGSQGWDSVTEVTALMSRDAGGYQGEMFFWQRMLLVSIVPGF